MAYRELGVIELREVWRRYSQGEGLRAIARGLGADRKTVAKIVTAGVAVGLQRGAAPPTEDQLGRLVALWRATPVGRPAALPERLAPYQPQIQAWLADGLRLTKIHRRLREQGFGVAYSSLHRFAHQRLDGRFRGHQRLWPGAGQPAMQGHPGAHLEAEAAGERQAFDNIEAVEFGTPRRHVGKVPARWRGRAADPSAGIQSSAALEDPADRSYRRHHRGAARPELAVDGPGSILAQIARLLQLAAQAEDEVLHRRGRPPDPRRDRRTIAPVDTIQGQIAGTAAPPLHGGKAHLMRPCDRSHRCTGPNLRDDRAPLQLPSPRGFLPIASSSRVCPKHRSDREALAPQ
jgi:hypothetical protein